MCSKYYLIFLFVHCTHSGISKSAWNFNCTTPNDQHGICIDLRECDELFRIIIRKPLMQRDRIYLRKSQCGYQDRSPLVCCPAPRQEKQDQRQLFDVDHLPKPGVCGNYVTKEIRDDNVPRLGEFPWMAQILYWKRSNKIKSYCGGVLVNENYVITASHCVSGAKFLARDAIITAVRLGDAEEEIIIDEVIPHREYNRTSFFHENDIALLRLSRPVQFTDGIKPICLPIFAHSLNYDELKYTVTSWGATNAMGFNVMLKVSMPGVPLNSCNSQYNIHNISIGSKQLCAGGIERYDSCHGDSGNPLMFWSNYWYLGGIVSFGTTVCGSKGWPGVYTRISSHIDWILQNIRH